MALRNQPYLPLYIQDILTDEKLALCSAEANGVYLRLMCILHKQKEYGKICIKQKHKQNECKFTNFAWLLRKQMPFSEEQIKSCIEELFEEEVIEINDNELFQKRMVKDGELSLLRSNIGKTGGSSVTKQYGKKGFLYLMSDGFGKNKIGISVNPKNRLYRLRCDLKLPKHFDIKYEIKVDDMGLSEDIAHKHFNNILDGEWLKADYEDIKDNFVLLIPKIKAKNEANSESEYEDENESVIGFNFFWNLYDKKVGSKSKLEKKWNKLSTKKQQLILDYIPKYKLSQPDKKYRKNPETFLNNESWEDELITQIGNNGQTEQHIKQTPKPNFKTITLTGN